MGLGNVFSDIRHRTDLIQGNINNLHSKYNSPNQGAVQDNFKTFFSSMIEEILQLRRERDYLRRVADERWIAILSLFERMNDLEFQYTQRFDDLWFVIQYLYGIQFNKDSKLENKTTAKVKDSFWKLKSTSK
jgi:hypothetical protein